MLEKLDERHKEWLISGEEIEIETFIAEGIGQWSDPEQRLLELAAMRQRSVIPIFCVSYVNESSFQINICPF